METKRLVGVCFLALLVLSLTNPTMVTKDGRIENPSNVVTTITKLPSGDVEIQSSYFVTIREDIKISASVSSQYIHLTTISDIINGINQAVNGLKQVLDLIAQLWDVWTLSIASFSLIWFYRNRNKIYTLINRI